MVEYYSGGVTERPKEDRRSGQKTAQTPPFIRRTTVAPAGHCEPAGPTTYGSNHHMPVFWLFCPPSVKYPEARSFLVILQKFPTSNFDVACYPQLSFGEKIMCCCWIKNNYYRIFFLPPRVFFFPHSSPLYIYINIIIIIINIIIYYYVYCTSIYTSSLLLKNVPTTP